MAAPIGLRAVDQIHVMQRKLAGAQAVVTGQRFAGTLGQLRDLVAAERQFMGPDHRNLVMDP